MCHTNVNGVVAQCAAFVPPTALQIEKGGTPTSNIIFSRNQASTIISTQRKSVRQIFLTRYTGNLERFAFPTKL